MADDEIDRAGLPDIIRSAPRKRDRALALARRATDRARQARESAVGQWLESRARDAADLALSRESLETMQHALTIAANFGLNRARNADEDVDLMLEFLEWLEQKHGRDVVAPTFARNTPVLRDPWMKLVQGVATPWENGASPADLRDARDAAAQLLGELAGLEHPETVPQSAEQLVDYFDSEWIPARFLPLAEVVAGLRPSDAQSGRTANSALARFVPTLADPSVYFIVSSLLAVSNAYLTRELLERFPDMIEMLRDET